MNLWPSRTRSPKPAFPFREGVYDLTRTVDIVGGAAPPECKVLVISRVIIRLSGTNPSGVLCELPNLSLVKALIEEARGEGRTPKEEKLVDKVGRRELRSHLARTLPTEATVCTLLVEPGVTSQGIPRPITVPKWGKQGLGQPQHETTSPPPGEDMREASQEEQWAAKSTEETLGEEEDLNGDEATRGRRGDGHAREEAHGGEDKSSSKRSSRVWESHQGEEGGAGFSRGSLPRISYHASTLRRPRQRTLVSSQGRRHRHHGKAYSWEIS